MKAILPNKVQACVDPMQFPYGPGGGEDACITFPHLLMKHLLVTLLVYFSLAFSSTQPAVLPQKWILKLKLINHF